LIAQSIRNRTRLSGACSNGWPVRVGQAIRLFASRLVNFSGAVLLMLYRMLRAKSELPQPLAPTPSWGSLVFSLVFARQTAKIPTQPSQEQLDGRPVGAQTRHSHGSGRSCNPRRSSKKFCTGEAFLPLAGRQAPRGAEEGQRLGPNPSMMDTDLHATRTRRHERFPREQP
jgi:hypothetical protein